MISGIWVWGIWMIIVIFYWPLNSTKFFSLQRVDSKKLERAEQLLQKKLEKREGGPATTTAVYYKGSGTDGEATATQALSRRDENAGDGNSQTKDIKIENFDVSFGDKVNKPSPGLNRHWNQVLVNQGPATSLVDLASLWYLIPNASWAWGFKLMVWAQIIWAQGGQRQSSVKTLFTWVFGLPRVGLEFMLHLNMI